MPTEPITLRRPSPSAAVLTINPDQTYNAALEIGLQDLLTEGRIHQVVEIVGSMAERPLLKVLLRARRNAKAQGGNLMLVSSNHSVRVSLLSAELIGGGGPVDPDFPEDRFAMVLRTSVDALVLLAQGPALIEEGGERSAPRAITRLHTLISAHDERQTDAANDDTDDPMAWAAKERALAAHLDWQTLIAPLHQDPAFPTSGVNLHWVGTVRGTAEAPHVIAHASMGPDVTVWHYRVPGERACFRLRVEVPPTAIASGPIRTLADLRTELGKITTTLTPAAEAADGDQAEANP